MLALLTSIVGLSVYSCGSDDNDNDYYEPNVVPSFSSHSTHQISKTGGNIECNINNFDSYTEAHSTVSWMTTTIGVTSSAVKCFISLSKNETSLEREGTVELMHKGQVVDQIKVIQEAGDGNGEDVDPDDQGEFGAPTRLTLSKNGCEITLSWQKVPNAIKYLIYHLNPTAYDAGYFASTHSTTSTTYTMNCKIKGT